MCASLFRVRAPRPVTVTVRRTTSLNVTVPYVSNTSQGQVSNFRMLIKLLP